MADVYYYTGDVMADVYYYTGDVMADVYYYTGDVMAHVYTGISVGVNVTVVCVASIDLDLMFPMSTADRVPSPHAVHGCQSCS